MDFSTILKDMTSTLEDIKKGKTDEKKENMYRQEEFFNSSNNQLKRHKADSGAKFGWIMPVMLNFPFNPLDPNDTTFNSRKKFLLKADALTGWLAIKQAMRENSELHNMYAKLLGISPEEYSLEPKIEYLPDGTEYEYVTSKDLQLINTFKIPAQLSAYTQKITTSATGQYGREFRSPLLLDDESQILDEKKNTLAYQILDLELNIRAEKLGHFKLNNDTSSLTSDQKDNQEAIRKSMQMTFPRLSGVTIFQELEADKSNNKLKELSAEESTFDKTLTYMNCGKDTLEKLHRLIGSKNDANPNYMLIRTTYGTNLDKSNKEYFINLFKSRDMILLDVEDWRKYTPTFIKYFMEQQEISDENECIKALANRLKYSDPRTLLGTTTLEVGDDFHDPLTGQVRKANRLDIEIAKIQDFDQKYMEYNMEGLSGTYENEIKQNVYKYRYMSDAALLAAYAPRVGEIKPYITSEIYEKFDNLLSQTSPSIFSELKSAYLENKLAISYKDILNGSALESKAEEIQNSLNEMNKMDEEEANEMINEEEPEVSPDVKTINLSE